SYDIVSRFDGDDLLFVTGELCLQRLRDSFGDLALDAKDVSQLPIIGFGPEMGIGLCIHQLHIDPHLISYFLHASLKNGRDTELLRDVPEIGRSALILLRGSARDYF